MTLQDKRSYFLTYAHLFVGQWYKWGGDDPTGFDCSGFVIECLKSVGMVDRKADYTAHNLMTMFAHKEVVEPFKGCLVFYTTNEGKAYHVEICVSDELSLGASGGGSKTLTIKDAMKTNAFIKTRKIRLTTWRKFVDVFKED